MLKIIKKIFRKKKNKVILKQTCSGENNIQVQICEFNRIEKDKFPDELKKNYPMDDYHFLYYGEIVDCYN